MSPEWKDKPDVPGLYLREVLGEYSVSIVKPDNDGLAFTDVGKSWCFKINDVGFGMFYGPIPPDTSLPIETGERL